MSKSYALQDAIEIVQHVIQDHADEDYNLGKPANMGKVKWLAKLLGWNFPENYLEFISIFDGVHAGGYEVISSDRAFDVLSVFEKRWHKPNGYWPVGSDGCGDYWVMSISQQGENAPGTVFFYDHEIESDRSNLTEIYAPDYSTFVAKMMLYTCEEYDCDWIESVR